MKTFDDWPQPISLKGRGLKLHEFWWYMYAMFCEGPTGYMPKMSAKAIVTFNKSFYHVKESFGFSSQDMKAAIYFAYMTNPLGLTSRCEYGYFEAFRSSLPIFVKWYSSVEDKGDLPKVFRKINEEARKSNKKDNEVDSMMNEFLVAMRNE